MGHLETARMLHWVAAGDRRFLRALDETLAQGTERAGAHLVCRVGCTDCCMGSFPITPLDARRLRDGFERFRHLDPERAGSVLERAEAMLAEHDSEGPCPALDPRTGACEVYDARPVTCRTYGLPVRIGDDRLPPCRLCFTTASAAEIEAARVTIDPQGEEEALLASLAETNPDEGDTTVAGALAAAGRGAR